MKVKVRSNCGTPLLNNQTKDELISAVLAACMRNNISVNDVPYKRARSANVQVGDKQIKITRDLNVSKVYN
jgi:hypothetical protein